MPLKWLDFIIYIGSTCDKVYSTIILARSRWTVAAKAFPKLSSTLPVQRAPVDETEPLPGDRWLASKSVLQKAIRRGDVLIAPQRRTNPLPT